MNTFWRQHGTYKDKRVAKRNAKILREPGKDRVRARVIKEIFWRVEFAEIEQGRKGR